MWRLVQCIRETINLSIHKIHYHTITWRLGWYGKQRQCPYVNSDLFKTTDHFFLFILSTLQTKIQCTYDLRSAWNSRSIRPSAWSFASHCLQMKRYFLYVFRSWTMMLSMNHPGSGPALSWRMRSRRTGPIDVVFTVKLSALFTVHRSRWKY